MRASLGLCLTATPCNVTLPRVESKPSKVEAHVWAEVPIDSIRSVIAIRFHYFLQRLFVMQKSRLSTAAQQRSKTAKEISISTPGSGYLIHTLLSKCGWSREVSYKSPRAKLRQRQEGPLTSPRPNIAVMSQDSKNIMHEHITIRPILLLITSDTSSLPSASKYLSGEEWEF